MHFGVVSKHVFLRQAVVWMLFLVAVPLYKAQVLNAGNPVTENGGWIVMDPTRDQASLEGDNATHSYCHPGFDCVLANLCSGVSWFIAGIRHTCENSFITQVHLTGIALTFDPPPPRS